MITRCRECAAVSRAFGPTRERRRCLSCHDAHGSTNANLVRPAIRTGGRLRPIDFHAAGGAVAGGFVTPDKPGRGLCEVCHRDTRFYPANGRGEPHFTGDCADCHVHEAGFRFVAGDVVRRDLVARIVEAYDKAAASDKAGNTK